MKIGDQKKKKASIRSKSQKQQEKKQKSLLKDLSFGKVKKQIEQDEHMNSPLRGLKLVEGKLVVDEEEIEIGEDKRSLWDVVVQRQKFG